MDLQIAKKVFFIQSKMVAVDDILEEAIHLVDLAGAASMTDKENALSILKESLKALYPYNPGLVIKIMTFAQTEILSYRHQLEHELKNL